ncbi:MAG: cell division protein ZapB [Thermoanaerobaculia bacterium]
MDILDTLESKVREAASQLTSLREENAALAEKVRDLDGRLEEMGDGAASWEDEKESVRKRVEKLVTGLKELLAE